MKNIIQICGNLKLCNNLPIVAALGVFDGVHHGHRQIIRQAAYRAKECGGKVLALSFSPHPRAMLKNAEPPTLLLSEKQREKMLISAGADAVGFINFTYEVAALTPERFLQELRDLPMLDICGICVGSRWRFGCGGSGGRAELDKFCRENNWSFDPVPEVENNGVTISSSLIRQAISAGKLDYAASMLGSAVQLSGIVEHGFHIASEKLSAPTANLRVTAGVMVPDGVYSGSAEVDGRSYAAALNIGVAPTFGNGLRRVEIHLIGFDGSLYGRELTVKLHRFLRNERRFSSSDELKQQIACDIQAIMQDHDLQK